METLTPREITYVTKLTALLRNLHETKEVDITDSKALYRVLNSLAGLPTSDRLLAIQKAVIDEAVSHLTRTMN